MENSNRLKRRRVELEDEPRAYSVTSDRFFLCFKGLVEEHSNTKSKAKLGAIAVGIFDSEDDLLFELTKPLAFPQEEMTDELAELEALVEGLEFALSLNIGNLMFPYTDSLYPYLYGNQKGKGAKVAGLADRAILLRKTFRNFHPYIATARNVELVSQFAKSSIAKQARNLNKEECLICLEDDIDPDKMFEIDGCRHRFCSSCIEKHVQIKVGGDRELPLCPQPKCGLLLNIDACRKFLSSKRHEEILDELVKESSIPAEEKVYCPNPKCSKLMSKTEVLANNKSLGWASSVELNACRCLKCRALFCISCKVLWHSNISCDSYKKGELADQKFDKLSKKKKWKKCPKCSHMVERNKGCKHIHCRCGTDFCYGCGCEYKNNQTGAPCSCTKRANPVNRR